MLKSSVRSDDNSCNESRSDGHKSHTMCDGTPCAMKVARTVWTGGKAGDYFKCLPIGIFNSSDIATVERRVWRFC